MLWHLDLLADGPVSSPSQLVIEFDLNPLALSEISFPTSFLTTLPGYSGSLSPLELAALIDDAIKAQILAAFSVDATGMASLADYSLFPDGTMYSPAAAEVVYGDGVNAGIQNVPEPPMTSLLFIGLIAIVALSRRPFARLSVGDSGLRSRPGG
jgi:hypothetical protein